MIVWHRVPRPTILMDADSAWRDAFLARGEAGLKIREEDLFDSKATA